MNGYRIMIFQYAAMFGVPILLVLTAIAYALSLSVLYLPIEALLILGLLAYGIVSFIEIYAHKGNPDRIPMPEERDGIDHTRGAVGGKGKPITLVVKRFNRETQSLEKHVYKTAADKFTSVLDALIDVKDKSDPTLSMRYSCRMGICGSCGMNINGEPALACEKNALACAVNGEIDVSPMLGHPLLKDLVTDFDDFFEKHKEVEPHLFRENAMEKYKANRIYKQNMREENAYLPFSYCIMCGLCLDACPVVNSNPRFIGPQALSQAYRYHEDTRDQKGKKRLDLVDSLEGVWGCEFIGACSDACPKGVDPALAIQLLKSDIMKANLLGDPKGSGD